jgi:hypothetical protein
MSQVVRVTIDIAAVMMLGYVVISAIWQLHGECNGAPRAKRSQLVRGCGDKVALPV